MFTGWVGHKPATNPNPGNVHFNSLRQKPPTSVQGFSGYGGLIVGTVGFVVAPNLVVGVPNMSHVQTNLRLFKAAGQILVLAKLLLV
jgi:hypothetical protein